MKKKNAKSKNAGSRKKALTPPALRAAPQSAPRAAQNAREKKERLKAREKARKVRGASATVQKATSFLYMLLKEERRILYEAIVREFYSEYEMVETITKIKMELELIR